MSDKKIRYEIEVEGAKGYLAPLSFAVCEIAMANRILPFPKLLTAGAILINSLWVRGSKKLQERGELFDDACIQATAILSTLEENYNFENNEITVHLDGKKYSCKISDKINRESLEEALGLLAPNGQLPRPLTAGKNILLENWISGDEIIKTNEELLSYCSIACYNLLKFKTGKIKKV